MRNYSSTICEYYPFVYIHSCLLLKTWLLTSSDDHIVFLVSNVNNYSSICQTNLNTFCTVSFQSSFTDVCELPLLLAFQFQCLKFTFKFQSWTNPYLCIHVRKFFNLCITMLQPFAVYMYIVFQLKQCIKGAFITSNNSLVKDSTGSVI